MTNTIERRDKFDLDIPYDELEPTPKSKLDDTLISLGISLQFSVHRRLKEVAKMREQSVSSLIRLAVKEWLKNNGY